MRKSAGLGLIVMVIAFFVVISVSGVPLVWLMHSIVPLSGVSAQNQLTVLVSPQIPTAVGQNMTITVQDRQTGQPIPSATVSISLNGNHLVDLATNALGQVSFDYPGETTIIVVSSGGYSSELVVLPNVPDAWSRDTIISIAVAVVSGLLVAYLSKRYID